MTEREGRGCEFCGYPVQPDAEICGQCEEWQGVAQLAETAIAEAEEGEKE